MEKKKELIYSILFALLLIIVVAGGTFAYFSSTVTSNNSSVQTNSKKYDIIYNGGTAINGNIKILSSHENASNTTVQIGLPQDVDIAISANLFIKIEEISNELKIAGFKWEAYRLSADQEILFNSGNFAGYDVGDEVPIVTNYSLSTTLTSFKTYFWVDGNSTNNSIEGASFVGYIGARTNTLTGQVNNS